MKRVTIYTDGACSGNPGPGGWGAILIYKEQKLELSGFAEHTTNNRMELLAPIEALSRLKEPCEVDVYTDSAYLCNAFLQNWLANWVRRGWVKSDKKSVDSPTSAPSAVENHGNMQSTAHKDADDGE